MIQMSGGIVALRNLPRAGQCLIEIEADGELRLQVPGESVWKFPQTVQYMIGRRVSQAAMRLVLYDVAEVLQFADVGCCTAAIGNVIQCVFQQLRADAAGGTETAAFVREEMREIAVDREQIALRSEYQKRSAGGNIVESNGAPEFRRTEQCSGGAAGLYRLYILRTAIVQHLLDGHTKRVFVNAGFSAIAADAENFAARRCWRACGFEPSAAACGDVCGGDERFDVIDYGGLS